MLSVPNVEISKSVSNQKQKSFNLICQGTRSGCHVTNVGWSGPGGIKVNSTSVNGRSVSTLMINGSSYEGQYTCTVNYIGGAATGVYMHMYTGWSEIIDVTGFKTVLCNTLVLLVLEKVFLKFHARP